MSDKIPLDIDPDLPFEEEAAKQKSHMVPGCFTGFGFYVCVFGAWLGSSLSQHFDPSFLVLWIPAAALGAVIIHQTLVAKKRGFLQGVLIAVGIGLLLFGLCVGLISR